MERMNENQSLVRKTETDIITTPPSAVIKTGKRRVNVRGRGTRDTGFPEAAPGLAHKSLLHSRAPLERMDALGSVCPAHAALSRRRPIAPRDWVAGRPLSHR